MELGCEQDDLRTGRRFFKHLQNRVGPVVPHSVSFIENNHPAATLEGLVKDVFSCLADLVDLKEVLFYQHPHHPYVRMCAGVDLSTTGAMVTEGAFQFQTVQSLRQHQG